MHKDHDVRGITKTRLLICCGAFTLLSACHPGPVLDFGSRPPSVGGTIAGIVTTTDSSISATNRRVTVTNVRTATKYEATTAVDGGYTVQVPKGTYHIEVALEAGESLQQTSLRHPHQQRRSRSSPRFRYYGEATGARPVR